MCRQPAFLHSSPNKRKLLYHAGCTVNVQVDAINHHRHTPSCTCTRPKASRRSRRSWKTSHPRQGCSNPSLRTTSQARSTPSRLPAVPVQTPGRSPPGSRGPRTTAAVGRLLMVLVLVTRPAATPRVWRPAPVTCPVQENVYHKQQVLVPAVHFSAGCSRVLCDASSEWRDNEVNITKKSAGTWY